MIDTSLLISRLHQHVTVFKELLSPINPEQVNWRPEPKKWNLLEVTCHLLDEEKEDFRARLLHVLSDPNKPLSPIDPPGWVIQRNYAGQDFMTTRDTFFKEREESIIQLKSLKNPNWENFHDHPKFGQLSARMFLSNWVAHDILHFRQILSLHFGYLKEHSGTRMDYAGSW